MIQKNLKDYAHRAGAYLKRLSGVRFSRNAWTFLIFLVISSLLWVTMTLNQVIQRDVVCNLHYVNVPDSVTFITDPPDEVILSVRARGSQLIKYDFGSKPTIDIDFRYYNRGNKLCLTQAELRHVAQNVLGPDRTIEALSPDTLGILFTTSEPAKLPVLVNAVVNTAPNYRRSGPVVPVTDTVSVYSVNPLSAKVAYVETEPLRYNDVDKSFVSRVRLVAPTGCRVLPDSIDIRVNVETVVARSKNLKIEVVNVPPKYKMELLTTVVKVNYLVPAREVNTDPQIRVVADFESLPHDFSSEKVPLRLITNVDNACLEVNEVEYIITELRND